jgi:probable phosphoglycerate mutase
VSASLAPPGLGATLLLVRHGESTWNARGRFQGRRDPRLSPRGRAQAAALARRLADPFAAPPLPVPPGPPAAIWHSPLHRAADTARAVGARLPAALRPDERLTEIGQGAWEGRSHRAVTAMGPELAAWLADPTRTVAPGGETLASVRRRVRAAFADILADLFAPARRASAARPWGIVISHEGVLRVATLLLLDLPLSRFWALPFETAAITVVELAGGRAVLRAHGLGAHLAGPPGDGTAARASVDRRGAL